MVAAATRLSALLARVAVEIVFVVRPQVTHPGQDDDDDHGDNGCQDDQHYRLGHRTIHRGWPRNGTWGVRLGLDGGHVETSSALDSFPDQSLNDDSVGPVWSVSGDS